MSRQKNENRPVYQRGQYRLDWDRRTDGTLRSPFLQIFWYDPERGRERSRSTGTADSRIAADKLDAFYLERERGVLICPTCGAERQEKKPLLLLTSIADYLTARRNRPTISTMKARLAHVTAYLNETDRNATICDDVDAEWVDAFREWAIEIPIISPTGKVRERAPGTVEGSVGMLAAAINYSASRQDTAKGAQFKARPASQVSQTPSYRASIDVLASMFRYALQLNVKTGRPFSSRSNLLRFLQVSVATWCRPDAAHDVNTDKAANQWHPQHNALNLNPKGRAQTKKHRPIVPIARQFSPILNSNTGPFIKASSVKSSFESMLDELGLPRDGETGMKLIRRSMASLARPRLGEDGWIEGQIMLGHVVHSKTSDIYAAFEPGYLGRAQAVTEAIIDEIEALAPGAFHRKDTGLKVINGGKR